MPMSYKDNTARVVAEAERLAGRGIRAAAIFLANRVKEIVSVPAPRRIAIAGKRAKWVPPGTRYYVATTPAIAGAPPRKLSGQLRRSITWEYREDIQTARVGTNIVYGRRLELGFPRGHKPHPYLSVALERHKGQLATIIGDVAGGGR
jgi:phage gpG-like protein